MDIYSSTEYFTRKDGFKSNAQVLLVNFKKLLSSDPSVSPELQVSHILHTMIMSWCVL